MRRREFLQLDVFADRPGAGNPLAVVLDARDLDTEAMQAFANWTNLSETTFVLPPVEAGASYRVRIFTPRQELPFAGHPSIGTAHAVLEAGLAQPVDGQLVQECAAGLLPMTVSGTGAGRRIAVRAPRGRPRPLRVPYENALSAALADLPRGELAPALVDNGPAWWVVELADAAAVRAMVPDLAAIAALTGLTGAVGLAVFGRTPAGHDHALAVRAFCPADGIPEDPVTGSANAAIAAWIHDSGALPAIGSRYRVSQGREIGRDGRIEVSVDKDGEAWIGGQTQTVIRGTLDW
ncbi:MAG TPA: PhzF family phenazine biosynthesis protein [Arenimonas sp.]|uniref:PhzF family phenazine biosynthesis protein n=1 Tax=Arenimonas sp. TaxID=1872635 RepID=UPI002D80541C|nr:PhzF family phenazine biosynthesis protein [Arenimonas sp.]HEU0152013.1 PhzF family phenazine biosynthesis protein [Arenimonas sp.]